VKRKGDDGEGAPAIECLTQLNIVDEGRPSYQKLQDEKILAAGPISGSAGLAPVLPADGAPELGNRITSLPAWPRIETEMTSLTIFEDRALSIQRRLSDSRQQ
jgi:hypothetical protein